MKDESASVRSAEFGVRGSKRVLTPYSVLRTPYFRRLHFILLPSSFILYLQSIIGELDAAGQKRRVACMFNVVRQVR